MGRFRKNLEISIILFCFTAALFAQTHLLLAQQVIEPSDTLESLVNGDKDSDKDNNSNADEDESDEVDDFIDYRALKRAQFLRNIKDELRSAHKDLADLNVNVDDTESRLDKVHDEITTLSYQLTHLDSQIKTTEKLILNVISQIAERENEIMLLYRDIEEKNIEIIHQKKMLSEYLLTLYEQESAVTNTITNNSEINIAKLLLSDESVGQQLQQIKYFNILEQTGLEIFHTLEALVKELEEDQVYVEEQKSILENLYIRLEGERNNLEAQKIGKENLLAQTRGDEEIFQKLLDESKKQQSQITDEIKELSKNLSFVQQEMAALGDDFDPNDYRTLFTGERASVYAYINATRDDNSIFRLTWPVNPSRGISAYFRDASYATVFGVRHNAIDIPIPQKTTIRAPSEGVVYKIRDNGYGYSYLVLAHKGGYMTVYGHVYQFLVESGERVTPGQAIALSGGTPGTKGAGYMTTGAHLHFELMKGSAYVDPLQYLPLSFLTYDSLPVKYQALADEQADGSYFRVKRVVEGSTSDDPVENESLVTLSSKEILENDSVVTTN